MPDYVAKSSLYKYSKVGNEYIAYAPTIKGLVLSGGGARGIAYPAMQQAMEENGTLQNITHISGASAGAMTGSFMAIGYSSEEIKLLLTY